VKHANTSFPVPFPAGNNFVHKSCLFSSGNPDLNLYSHTYTSGFASRATLKKVPHLSTCTPTREKEEKFCQCSVCRSSPALIKQNQSYLSSKIYDAYSFITSELGKVLLQFKKLQWNSERLHFSPILSALTCVLLPVPQLTHTFLTVGKADHVCLKFLGTL